MNETIMLPVEYLGASHELPLTIVPLGYTYQLHIEVEGKTLIFEKDDQGEYRVIDTANNSGAVSKGFVAAIVATLQAL
ncbi:hypothetical protein J2Y45_004026 [Dyadobacter sp. BE34]|uniref:Uncharacterized protein n=1 Tax=Dyadobacter fermentans TaxID=94254 RepID=A0ABU1R091_9BACT|nr:MULTISPECIES: hypothetical protein [Dyadobacter]MDR6806834.1 hypothetical protein [Dyadobacter fermentans]MDR7044576.1 hypothetical protein [Dyadobacter sp. BE242]MDR7198886.1 hypothetical protein [Dyadobacter sp. BE34]MDR7216848.1 hypothetical protein [Dyadobacter sp. BE31]MDR7263626.1 hypothetical protein [Dyadobacter sp. BE32]